MKYIRQCIIIVLSVFCSFYSRAQDNNQDTAEVKKTKIFLENADIRIINKNISDQRELMRGNLIFRHDSSYMYCDSA